MSLLLVAQLKEAIELKNQEMLENIKENLSDFQTGFRKLSSEVILKKNSQLIYHIKFRHQCSKYLYTVDIKESIKNQ